VVSQDSVPSPHVSWNVTGAGAFCLLMDLLISRDGMGWDEPESHDFSEMSEKCRRVDTNEELQKKNNNNK